MGLKEELAEKLAGIDCKDKINEVINENREEIQKSLYLNRKDKGVLDAVQEKVISRKLLVFAVATGLLYWAGLDAETWAMGSNGSCCPFRFHTRSSWKEFCCSFC